MPNFLGAVNWDVGDSDVGAPRRRGGRGGGYQRRGGGGGNRSPQSNRFNAAHDRANRAASFAYPDMPGTPSMDAAILPAGWPIFSFALATGTNTVIQTMNPQCALRGQRLTAVVIRNGASALTTAPVIGLLQVGMKPIITTANPIALEIYSATAFDTNLLMPPTIPGVNYALGLSLAVALANADTMLCIVGVQGSAVL